jgi:aryl-alcohol dehydrogenase-like predicted oxidoreductase
MDLTARIRLGRSDLTVSRIGLGTAALALPYGPPEAERDAPAPTDAVAAITGALDAGVTLIDTAPTYGDAELLVGRAIRGRAEATVATKVTIPPDADRRSALRSAIRSSVEESLERLGCECIDLLQVHNATAALLATRTLTGELGALRDEGLVGALGATVYDEESGLAAIESDLFETVQVPYNALDRRPEQRLLRRARERGCGVLARSILMRGLLSSAARALPSSWGLVRAAVDEFRQAMGASWEELPAAALGFAVSAPGVSCAITGPRDGAELRDLMASASRFAARADAARALPARELEGRFLDPRAWPTIGTATTL